MKPQLTIEALIEFCERKPADEAYDVFDVSNCAIAQFGKSIGFKGSSGTFMLVDEAGRHAQIAGFKRAGMYRTPWTFGALAARLRAAQ